ncbi:MAG: hypothetical protein LBH93_08230, partial [Chitinispirillales bacterium]|nr:hypothetical protein [Chitinispirillales bacterium]
MAYRHCDNTGVVRRGVAAFAFVAMYALSGSSAPAPSSSAPSTLSSDRKTVTLSFVDSAMVNDTVIRLGDIAKVSSNDAALAAAFRAFAATEAAPAGYSRFVNSDDLVIFSVRPKFKGVEVVTANQKRVKVASDYQTRAIGEFIEQINSYAAERLAWASGEWSLAVANPQNSWKSGRGPVSAEVSGIDNPLAKGNIGLTLTVRQGSRVARIPVACKITVKAPVLTASRMIQRGEELTEENSKMQVT